MVKTDASPSQFDVKSFTGLAAILVLYYALNVSNSGVMPQWAVYESGLGYLFQALIFHHVFILGIFAVFIKSPSRQTLMRAYLISLAVGSLLFFMGITLPHASSAITLLTLGPIIMGGFLVLAFAIWCQWLAHFSMERVVIMLIVASAIGTVARTALAYFQNFLLFILVYVACVVCLTAFIPPKRPVEETLVDEGDGTALDSPSVKPAEDDKCCSGVLALVAHNYLWPSATAVIIFFCSSLTGPFMFTGASAGFLSLTHSLGMLVGSVLLFPLWRRRMVLFKSQNAMLLVALIVVCLFLLLPIGANYGFMFLFLVSALYSGAMVVLFASCVEMTKENEGYALGSCGLMLFAMFCFVFLGSVAEVTMRPGVHPSLSIALVAVGFTSIVAFAACIAFNRTSAVDEKSEDTKPSYVIIDTTASRIRNNHMLKNVYHLTEREFDVLELLLSAQSKENIARMLFISENTVKAHTKNLYRKLDVHNRSDLVDLVSQCLEDDGAKSTE